MIRVLVAASSPVSRAGLESIIARDPSMIVVGSEAGGATSTLAEEIATHEPDVLVVEGALDDEVSIIVGGDEHGTIGPAVVMLTAEANSSPRMAALLRAGGRALLPRDASVPEILAAVAAASAGLVSMPAAWMESLLPAPAAAHVVARAQEVDAPALTPREVEVLRMIAEGLANKQIAGRLGISEHTVKFHVAAVFEKLHASTRAEAVMIGARRGLIVL